MLPRAPTCGLSWCSSKYAGAFLIAQMIKNPPSMQETWIRSLGWEDSLEKGMATHSSILAGRIAWIKEPGGLWAMGLQRLGDNLVTEQQQQHI